MSEKHPKLRTVNKSVAPYPINEFPRDFAFLLGKEIVYLLASKGKPELEGSEWENVFANCIGADWKPSNVGLDDVVMGNTAWGAKTVKATTPSNQKKVRLISGRNSIVYSFGEKVDTSANPNAIGRLVLEIWNERVSAIREKYKHLRTVVLIKSANLSEMVVFEFDTIRYDTDLFSWKWNNNNNLIGENKQTGEHQFTWQPHGSQFTIIETVPIKKLHLKITIPPMLDKEQVLNALGFDETWITVVKNA